MASVFFIALAYVALPIAVILFFLTALPLPRSIKKWITWFSDKILFLEVYFIAFKIALIWLVILISGITLLSALVTARGKAAEVSAAQAKGIASMSSTARSLKWRAERNAWLAAFNLFAWFALWAYCSAVSQLNNALDRDDARAARAALGVAAGQAAQAGEGGMPAAAADAQELRQRQQQHDDDGGAHAHQE